MITVRPAAIEDAEQIWPLARDLATSYQLDAADYSRILEQLTATTGVLLLVAAADDQVIGYLLAQQHLTLHANGPVVWVEELMVDPGRRRRGVGHALMDAAERWGRAAGAAYVALATRRAADFYAALGYQPSATFFRRSL